MLGALLNEIIGEAVLGWLFPNWHKPEPRPAEGQWNGSLGSVAAFLASLAAMFACVSGIDVIQGRQDVVSFAFLAGTLVVSVLSAIAAHRTFRVTSRRHALARFALLTARAVFVFVVVVFLFYFRIVSFGAGRGGGLTGGYSDGSPPSATVIRKDSAGPPRVSCTVSAGPDRTKDSNSWSVFGFTSTRRCRVVASTRSSRRGRMA